MNDEHRFASNSVSHRPEDNHHPEDPEKAGPWSPLEQRLRKLRPQPPGGLTAETILREAAMSCLPPEQSGVPISTRRPQAWLIMAGSWASGAVAGAVLTWAILSRDGPVNPPPAVDVAATTQDNTDAFSPDPSTDSSPGGPKTEVEFARPWSRSEVLVSTMIQDNFEGIDMPPLNARTFLQEFTGEAVQPSQEVEFSNGNSAHSQSPLPHPATTPLNSDALLRELLGTAPEAIQ